MLTVHELLEDLALGILEVDAIDVRARNHDVLDRRVLEIENADQHFAMTFGDARPGLVHDRAQLFW